MPDWTGATALHPNQATAITCTCCNESAARHSRAAEITSEPYAAVSVAVISSLFAFFFFFLQGYFLTQLYVFIIYLVSCCADHSPSVTFLLYFFRKSLYWSLFLTWSCDVCSKDHKVYGFYIHNKKKQKNLSTVIAALLCLDVKTFAKRSDINLLMILES